MAYSASTPTSTASFGNVSRTGDNREAFAREIEACSAYIVSDSAQKGTIPASGDTNYAITSAAISGSTFKFLLADGNLRTTGTHGTVSAAITFAVQTTGAVQGETFTICKIATGGANSDTVTVDGKAFTARKKFNCTLSFVNGAWRLMGWHEYA